MARILAAAAAIVGALTCVQVARAQDGSATRAEVTALEAELQRASGLTSGACAIACPALGSMQRAADRICVIEPGPRCDAARAKVKEARRRVQEACPQCAVAGKDEEAPIQAKERERDKQAAPDAVPALPPPPPNAQPSTPPAAPAEAFAPKRGGCAGCETSADPTDTRTTIAIALGLMAIAGRRRKR